MNKQTLHRLLLTLLLAVWATAGFAQKSPTVTVSLKSAPIRSLFEQIQRQTGYSFVYSSEDIKALPAVTVSAKSESVERVLQRVLDGTGFGYRIKNKIITVKRSYKASTDTPALSGMRKVTGRVSDADGEPLPGASIVIKGTNPPMGCATDDEGQFWLDVPAADATTLVVSASVLTASADVIDRPNGFKIGERMTLRPYVSLSYTYDSNVDSTKHAKDGSSWVVNPGLGAEYKGENWEIAGRAWYRYHAYNHYSKQLNTSSYGETLTFKWADSLPNEKGWSVLLSESFTQIAQDDDMSNYSGRGLGRDRKTFQTAGIIERRINERLHAALDASYYLLDYDNDVKKYAPLYGWKRALVGGEVGYAASKCGTIAIEAALAALPVRTALTLGTGRSGSSLSLPDARADLQLPSRIKRRLL